MSLDYTTIGKKIKTRRLSLGITQECIANQLDVNPSHISNIETGKSHPSLTALISIANILKCSVDTFIEDEYSFSSEKKTLYDSVFDKLNACDQIKLEKISKIIDII